MKRENVPMCSAALIFVKPLDEQMVEEMAMVENDTKARAAVYKRTSAMLSEIITEDREHLSLIQRHGWQGTEEGKHTGNMADEPETKPSS